MSAIPTLSDKRDAERWATVYQWDQRGNLTATEFDPHATDAEIALALCDSDLPDCPIACILAGNIGDKLRDITEDVAKQVEHVAIEADRSGWRIQNCASDLLHRYQLFDPREVAA